MSLVFFVSIIDYSGQYLVQSKLMITNNKPCKLLYFVFKLSVLSVSFLSHDLVYQITTSNQKAIILSFNSFNSFDGVH